MRRLALLVVVCLVLALGTGAVSSPLSAQYCWSESKVEANGCCGTVHTKMNQYRRDCCQATGCGSWVYTGYYCTATCGPQF